MRRRRSETTAILRHARGALLWAMACSAASGVCLLSLPIAAALVSTEASATQPPNIQHVAVLAAFALAGSMLALTFSTIRDGILARAALWLEHALGAAALNRGIENVLPPTDIERDRADIGRLATGWRQSGAAFDVLGALPSVLLLLVIAPLPAAATLAGLACAGLCLGVSSQRLGATRARTARREGDADAVWRTAALSTVALAARGLAGPTTASWREAHGKAVAAAYSEAEIEATWSFATRAILAVASLVFAGSLAYLLQSQAISMATAAAATVAHAIPVLAVDSLRRQHATLAAAWSAREHLSADRSGLLDAHMVNPGQAPANPSPTVRPAAAQTSGANPRAEAS